MYLSPSHTLTFYDIGIYFEYGGGKKMPVGKIALLPERRTSNTLNLTIRLSKQWIHFSFFFRLLRRQLHLLIELVLRALLGLPMPHSLHNTSLE